MKKRILSFLLAFSMVLSLIPAVGFAEDGNKLAVLEINKIDTETCTVTDEAVDSAKPGDVIALTIGVKAGSADIGVAGYQFQLNFDGGIFALWSQTTHNKNAFYKKVFSTANIESDATLWSEPTGGRGDDYISLATTYVDSTEDYTSLNYNVTANGTMDLVQIALQVKADVESCATKFEFDSTYETLLVYYANANSDQVSELTFERETTALTINGVTPTLTSVSLPEGSDTVTVTGSGDSQSIQATAASLKGTNLTTSVAWSVLPVNAGVSIDAAGVITVANDATAGKYTIKAEPKDDKVQGGAQSATLTVVRDRRAAQITFVADNPSGNSSSITIPGTGVEAKEWTLTAAVFDQFETGMNDLQVTFSYDNALDNVSGVTVNTNTRNTLSLTVPSAAATSIPSSQDFTITASYTDGSNINISNTFTLTIQRAESEVKSIEIKDGADTIAVPTVAEEKKEIPYTAEVKDQYGTELTGKAVTWDLVNKPAGVEIDKDGKVTVVPSAAYKNTFDNNGELTFTVKATCEGVPGTTDVKLKRQTTSIVQSLAISGGQDAVAVPTGADEKVTFSAVITDQYGEEIPLGDDGVTWSVSSKVGVSIDKGVLKIENGAATFNNGFDETWKTTVTIQAECGIHKQTKDITLIREAPVAKQMSIYVSKDTFELPSLVAKSLQIPLKIDGVDDQYGQNMTDKLAKEVTWGNLTGVTIAKDPTGNYTDYIAMIDTAKVIASLNGVRKDTKISLNASYDQATDSQEITLTLAGAQATSIELDGTDSDTVVIPSSNKKYTATVKDQYGLMMPGAQVTYSISPKDANVTIDSNGLVTVLAGATKDREYTITATYSQNVTATRTFKVVDKVSDTTTLKVEQADITFGESVNPQVTGAPAGTTAVTFTYEALEGSALTDGQPVNKGQYKVIARCESDTTIYTAEDTFEIKAKAITADMFTVTEKTYTYNGIGYDFEYQTTLVKNTDYTVTGTSHKDAGTYTVAFAGQGNYTGEVKAAWTIAPAVLKVKSVQLTSRAYDPSSSTVSVAAVEFEGLVAGETLSAANNYIAQATLANNNAGTRTAQVTVTLRTGTTEKAKNYTFENGVVTATVSADVQITKIAYTGTTATSTSAKYGNTATLDLSALGLPEGYDFAQGTVQDENGILAGAEAAGYYVISGNTLRVPLVNNAAKAGKTATITLPVSSTNYASFDLVITVTVNDKLENSLAANDIYLTYGDTGYVTVTSIIGSLQTEIVSGEDVIALDNGTIKTLKAGTATLKLTASGDENYAEKSIQVKVTVSPKPITLTIDSKSAYVNDAQPALTYKVNGLVGADQLTTAPVLFVDVAEGVDPMKQVGTYAIKTSVNPDAGKNYSLTVEEGTLSVTNRPSAITPVGPSAGTVRVDETEGGTVRVTPANAAEGSTVTIVVTPDQGQELRSLEVLDKDGDSLELTDLGGGRFSFEMPRGKVTVKAEFGKAGLPYHDVKEGDWFYSAVEYVTEAGLMGDTGHGSFEPNTNTTRAMIWAILARLSGADTTPVSGPWYSVAQEWAMNSGVSDGTNPNGAITREQLVTMLYRYAETHGIDVTEGGMAIREFADVESVSSFAGPAMTWAVNTGLISGIDGKLVPQGLATRSQVATVLMRFAQLAK